MKEPLTVAVPKGRLLPAVMDLLHRGGWHFPHWHQEARSLVQVSEGLPAAGPAVPLRLLLAKPTDVPVYVEYGAADVGIAGQDVLWEAGLPSVLDLVDLAMGACRMVLAVPVSCPARSVGDLQPGIRVATKYPAIAGRYFERLGLAAEVVALHGSVELAPAAGLADAIVDLTETGRTLRENDLRILDVIAHLDARLVSGQRGFGRRSQEILALARRLAALVAEPKRQGGSLTVPAEIRGAAI